MMTFLTMKFIYFCCWIFILKTKTVHQLPMLFPVQTVFRGKNWVYWVKKPKETVQHRSHARWISICRAKWWVRIYAHSIRTYNHPLGTCIPHELVQGNLIVSIHSIFKLLRLGIHSQVQGNLFQSKSARQKLALYYSQPGLSLHD